MRNKVIVGSLLGAVAIHAAFMACGMPSMQSSGGGPMGYLIEAMRDAAGLEIGDASAQDSGGARLAEATCEKVSNGFYYADISVAGFDPLNNRDFSVSVCKLSCTAATCGFARPGGSNASVIYDCLYNVAAWTRRDHITVLCGSESDRGQVARVSLR